MLRQPKSDLLTGHAGDALRTLPLVGARGRRVCE
jgi:hypothetical protein